LALPALTAMTWSGAAAAAPRLAVVVVFDQLRPVDLDRVTPLVGSGGFGGLMDRGSARYDARYPYAVTETGPGHATLATGTSPSGHGICANRWKDAAGQTVYCVTDADYPVLGRPPAATPDGISARHLLAPTLGD